LQTGLRTMDSSNAEARSLLDAKVVATNVGGS
jgi:hypothetical protein